jgi:hypothetical protein
MVFHDVAIHQKGEGRWAQLAAKPQIDRDGNAIKDNITKKIRYSPLTEFTNDATRRAFSHKVCEAVEAVAADAFEAAEEDAFQ